MMTAQKAGRLRHRHTKSRLMAASTGDAAAIGLVAGPLAERALAWNAEVSRDTSATRLFGRVEHADLGSEDRWTDQQSSEGKKHWSDLAFTCGWQGFRAFVHEQSGNSAWQHTSAVHNDCVLAPQWADHPSRTTSELWDLVFKWTSSNTGNQLTSIGTVDR